MDRSLEQFLAVAEAGSIIGAATALGMSQPALTYSLKRLEQTLGVELFDRTPRGVRLTIFGETLYENATIMRRLYKNALTKIARQRAEVDNGLSVGSGYSYWNVLLRDIVRDHARRFPTAPVNVSLGNAIRCMDQLLAGDISLFLGQRIANLAYELDADFIPLGLTRDSYFVRAGHPLLSEPQRRADVLAQPTALAFSPEARLSRLIPDGCTIYYELPPDGSGNAFTSSSLEACLDYIQDTDAVLIHNGIMAQIFAERGIMQIELLPDEQPPWWPMGIYVMKERRSDARVEALIDLIAERAAKLGMPPVAA